MGAGLDGLVKCPCHVSILLSLTRYIYPKETAQIKKEKTMENILVVIRDEIRENRKVLMEILDILKDQRRGREQMKQAPKNYDKPR